MEYSDRRNVWKADGQSYRSILVRMDLFIVLVVVRWKVPKVVVQKR